MHPVYSGQIGRQRKWHAGIHLFSLPPFPSPTPSLSHFPCPPLSLSCSLSPSFLSPFPSTLPPFYSPPPLFPFLSKLSQSRTEAFLVIPLKKHPLRDRQKYVSQMILNLINLTMKIESHSDGYYVCGIILSILCILTYCRLTVAFINTLACIRQHYSM